MEGTLNMSYKGQLQFSVCGSCKQEEIAKYNTLISHNLAVIIRTSEGEKKLSHCLPTYIHSIFFLCLCFL